MSKLHFQPNAEPTLGVEIELALVDGQTAELSSSILDVLARLPEQHHQHVKSELMQCYLEINTDVCHTIGQAERDLREKIPIVERVMD